MHLDQVVLYALRKILLLTGLGVVGIVVASLLLSVFSVLLVVALTSWLLWMPLHTLVLRHDKPIKKCWHKARRWGRTVGVYGQMVHDEVVRQARNADNWMRRALWFARPFAVEIGAGAVLGSLLAAVGPGDLAAEPMLIGAGLGAAVGFVVALSRGK